MTVKYLAALAVSGILTVALPISAGIQDSKAVELAGADEEDEVMIDQLLKSGQVQLPAPYLKIAETKSTLSAKPVNQTLTRPNPELQPEKNIAEPEPKPEPNLAEQTNKVVVPEPEPAEPVKKAAELASKEEPKATLDAKKKVVSELGQPTIAAPYFRMDVGYGFVLRPEGTTTAGDMTGEDVANLAIFGAGVGYRISENLRVDLTTDYRADSEIDGTTPDGIAVSSEINGLAVMLNGYYDIQTFDGFIPYVGGGLGFTRLDTAAQTGPAATGDTSTNLAWALSLGSAIDVGNGGNTMADVGYRFVSLGGFKQNDGTTYDDLMVHEFRAGFRHQF